MNYELITINNELRTTNYQLYSTFVEDSLQISPFLTNKANFRKSQMNVSSIITKDYEKRTLGQRGKNKPKTNPIQSQYKANSNPIRTQTKPISEAKKCVWMPQKY